MPEAKLSVVIPTYNRSAVLIKALSGYAHQTARAEILEIVVVDDGSTDATGERVAEFARTSPIPVRYLRQENRGQAAARNYGIREALGELVLLTDDDIIPAPTLVEEHLGWHIKYPDHRIGVLGNVPWSPEVNPTPFQRWWGVSGIRFRPPQMCPGQSVSAAFILFGNTSLKAALLTQIGPFDENFRTWGFEDTDYAYRLVKRGGKVLFNPDAVGYHHKRVLFSDACREREKAEPSRLYFARMEAGIEYAELRAKWESTRSHRIKKLLARCFVPLVSPFRSVLDSQFPLPGRVYDLFFIYYVEIARPEREGCGSNGARRRSAESHEA